jgi:hypothetical protein
MLPNSVSPEKGIFYIQIGFASWIWESLTDGAFCRWQGVRQIAADKIPIVLTFGRRYLPGPPLGSLLRDDLLSSRILFPFRSTIAILM